MAIGDERRAPARAGTIAPRRTGADREIELSRTVEASMADGTTRRRDDTSGPHDAVDTKGAARVYDRPGRGTHVALAVGALLMLLIPWLLLAALKRAGESGNEAGSAAYALIGGLVRIAAAVAGMLLVSRRLRRSISPRRLSAYIAGAWLLALGMGLMMSRLDARLGDILFDAGTLTIFALFLTDSVLRRRRHGEA